MARNEAQRKANYDYVCAKCGGTIGKGTQYICVTYHEVRHIPIKNSQKIYHGRTYYQDVHTNVVKRYHIGCEE